MAYSNQMRPRSLTIDPPLTLDALAMVRHGQNLRDRRLAMNLRPSEVGPRLMAARTQIEGIELGESGAFYSPRYYLNLFERYAQLLGVSADDLAAMVSDLRGPVTPTPEEAGVMETAEDGPASEADRSAGPPSEDCAAQVASLSSAPADGPAREHDHQSQAGSVPESVQHPSAVAGSSTILNLPTALSGQVVPQSRGLRLWQEDPPRTRRVVGRSLSVLLLAAGVAAAGWWLLNPSERITSAANTVAVMPTPTAQSTAEARAVASGEPAPTPPVLAPLGAPPAQAPASVPVTPPSAATLATPSPSGAATLKPAANMPALRLQFSERSWYWVRRADGSVSELGAGPGEIVDFDAMPSYLVLARPGTVKVETSGRQIDLRRNQEGRDMGRYTRTMLERGLSQPPSPSEPATAPSAVLSPPSGGPALPSGN